MELDSLVRETMRDWAREAEVPPGLADRALRGRSRRRVRAAGYTAGLAALVTAVCLIAVNLAVPDRTAPDWDPALAKVVTAPGVAGTDVRADPKSSPPKRLVTAGRMALSAYYSGRPRTWYLYDPASGGYVKTPWSYLDVARGLGRAAVLEGPLPARRVGIYDMVARRILRWLPLERPAGGVAWSPDGRRLLVTHYVDNPDRPLEEGLDGAVVAQPPPSRIGYSVIDLATGRAEFHRFPGDENNGNARQDVGWSRDGSLIWEPTATDPPRRFYSLDGKPRPAPANENTDPFGAGLSPDGRHLATEAAGAGPGPRMGVADADTGEIVGTQRVEQLVAWADNGHLIALACDLKNCTGKGEFRNRFVQVDIGGGDVVPLTGFRENNQAPDSWEPVFTER